MQAFACQKLRFGGYVLPQESTATMVLLAAGSPGTNASSNNVQTLVRDFISVLRAGITLKGDVEEANPRSIGQGICVDAGIA